MKKDQHELGELKLSYVLFRSEQTFDVHQCSEVVAVHDLRNKIICIAIWSKCVIENLLTM